MKSTLRHIFPLLLTILSALGSQLSAFAERPQLVIGIVADQLQTDYLQDLLPLMGQGGFNRAGGQGRPQGGFNRSNNTRPAAPAAPAKEGGAN